MKRDKIQLSSALKEIRSSCSPRAASELSQVETGRSSFSPPTTSSHHFSSPNQLQQAKMESGEPHDNPAMSLVTAGAHNRPSLELICSHRVR